MYLYKTKIYYDTTNVIDAPADNDTNLSDFNNNHKSSALLVDDVSVAETTFILEKSYSDFDALVSDPITWEDVKYIDDGISYNLFLTSSNPL